MSSSATAAAAAAPAVTEVSNEMICREGDPAVSLPCPLPLGPNDWIIPHMPLQLLFFHSRPSSIPKGEFMRPERLRSSLQRLLAHYPHLDGALEAGEKGTLVVRWSGGHAAKEGRGGVRLTFAKAECELASLPVDHARYTSPDSIPGLHSLTASSFDFTNPTASPLLHVKVTHFACGSAALALSLHHMLSDLEGTLQLVRDWAALYSSDSDKLADGEPTIDRAWVTPDAEEIERRLKDHEEKVHEVPSTPRPFVMPPPCVARNFHFSGTQLDRLVAAAAGKETTDPAVAPAPWLSRFEALAALLHRCMFRARAGSDPQLPEEREVRMVMATNWRRRLRDPKCEPKFFANAAIYTPLHLPARVLRTDDFATTAARVHHALSGATSDRMRAHMAWITSQSDRSAIRPLLDFQLGGGITAWNKFGSYEIEWDGSKPLRMIMPSWIGANGVQVVFDPTPDANDPRALDVCVGIEPEALERLERDEEWRQFRE